MRLSPPVPTGPPSEVLAGGINIDNIHYPEGTVLSVPTYVIQRTEKYFAEPEAFKPERWIAESANHRTQKASNFEAISLAKSTYFPFSLGPRKCIGQRLALLQINVALARIVWLYDMRLAVDQRSVSKDRDDKRIQVSSKIEPEYPLLDYLVAVKEGPMVQFKPKET